MPVLMTVSVILSVYYAVQLNAIEGASRMVRWASAVSLVAALVSTIIFNVPIMWRQENGTRITRQRLEGVEESMGVLFKGCGHGFY
jgi:hypothetical protein